MSTPNAASPPKTKPLAAALRRNLARRKTVKPAAERPAPATAPASPRPTAKPEPRA